MKDSKYFNLRELTLDLNEILNEVEYLREENAELKKQVADYKDFIRNLKYDTRTKTRIEFKSLGRRG